MSDNHIKSYQIITDIIERNIGFQHIFDDNSNESNYILSHYCAVKNKHNIVRSSSINDIKITDFLSDLDSHTFTFSDSLTKLIEICIDNNIDIHINSSKTNFRVAKFDENFDYIFMYDSEDHTINDIIKLLKSSNHVK